MVMTKVIEVAKILWVKMEIFQGVSDVILQAILLQSAQPQPTNTSQVILMTYMLLFCISSRSKTILFKRGNFRYRSLDLGSTKTVSGELWMEEHLKVLPGEWMKTAKTNNNTSSKYHFSDGKESKVIRNVVASAAMGNKQYIMLIDVIKNIPLLISKKSMISLGMKLNFLNDTTYFGDRSIPSMCTTDKIMVSISTLLKYFCSPSHSKL